MTQLRDLSASLLDGRVAIDAAHPMKPLFVGESIADRAFFVSSFANVTGFSTSAGLVLVDTGSFVLAEPTHALVRKQTPDPLHTAIWTHGHVDHCFGVEHYEREPNVAKPHVIAHEAIERRFARYRLTSGWNTRINARQFQTQAKFPTEFRSPDELVRTTKSAVIGDRRFEITHALGETDDHLWVYVPDCGVVCTGDLFIWASPNCGNPQKVQRFPREWAEALRAMAALEPEVLCPGHGCPIWGRANVRRALDDTASYLESLVDQVIDLMNKGARLDEILGRVRPPETLIARPYLSPVYDEPEFIVRNLYRLYGGWWDGNPAHLKPAPDEVIARELAALAGGAAKLAARAREVLPSDARLACHLIELASQAAPDDDSIRAERRSIYALRAAGERSLMAKGVFTAAATET